MELLWAELQGANLREIEPNEERKREKEGENREKSEREQKNTVLILEALSQRDSLRLAPLASLAPPRAVALSRRRRTYGRVPG